LNRYGVFTEEHARETLRAVVTGLQYMHAKGVVHRDIKPENVLLESKHFPLQARIGDFGLSDFLGKSGYAEKPCYLGTVKYMAPEQVRLSECGPPADMWACGVMLYEMLSCTWPFCGPSAAQVVHAIKTGVASFPRSRWSSASEEAKHLIRCLLHVDPARRPSAKNVLESSWMTNASRVRINT
jgi:serine/threonine protein kinase